MALSRDPDIPPIDRDEREVRDAFDLDIQATTVCFYCGESLTHPAIYWHGFGDRDGNLWFHEDCALGLAQHLVSDARRLHELMRLRARYQSDEAA